MLISVGVGEKRRRESEEKRKRARQFHESVLLAIAIERGDSELNEELKTTRRTQHEGIHNPEPEA